MCRLYIQLAWPFTIAVITCFCYVLIILLDHKKVRFSHLFQMCSKSISNDIIRFLPFCSNENMRFSYILIIYQNVTKAGDHCKYFYFLLVNQTLIISNQKVHHIYLVLTSTSKLGLSIWPFSWTHLFPRLAHMQSPKVVQSLCG